jgi:flagellar basal-body rod protein FlgF
MIYGLYLSAQGADAAAFHQAVLANNLANAGTTGFKRDIPVFRAHPPFDVSQLQPPSSPETFDQQTGGVTVEGTVTELGEFGQGALRATGADFDAALVGPGFFEVGAGDQRFLTRNGRFALNQDSVLVAADSNLPVLTVGGDRIEVPPNTVRLEISPEGLVRSIDGANLRTDLGQLSLVEPEFPEQLVKEGNTLFANLGVSRPSATTQVRQGMLEESNVEPVTEMIHLIQSSRGFEMNMGLVRLQDETVARLLQTIPRK